MRSSISLASVMTFVEEARPGKGNFESAVAGRRRPACFNGPVASSARHGLATSLISIAVGSAAVAAALGYKAWVDRRNERLARESAPIVIHDRPPIRYGPAETPGAVPARPPVTGRTPDQSFRDALRFAETLADQGEFAAALDRLALLSAEFPDRSAAVEPVRAEVEVLVQAACEEAEARARKDPVRGTEALEELAARVPAADSARLITLRDRLRSTAARDHAARRLAEADTLEKQGRHDDAVEALLEAARGLPGEEKDRALVRAIRLVQRVRYEGVVAPARLAAIPLQDLDAVERAVEAALAAPAGKPLEDALARLAALPEADGELVAAVILRGGTPLDAPVGERVVEHDVPGLGKRRYAVSVPDSGLPTRPKPLVLILEPGEGPPEIARGVARGWRQALEDRAIVAVGIPEQASGWGPNRRGESHPQAILADLRKRHLFDPDRVVLVGTSAGAHGVWFQAMRRGDLYAAFVGVAGTPYAPMYGSHWHDWIANLAVAPGRALVGAKEDVFPVAHARRFAELAREKGARVEVVEAADRAHEGASAEEVRKAVAWALSQKRATHPARIAWSTDNLADGRCSWLEITAISKDAGEVTVNFVDDFGRTVESRRIAKDCARVEARDLGTRIEIAATRVEKLRVWWDGPPKDVEPSVTVVVNGREAWRGIPGDRGPRFMIEEARRTGRRDRVSRGFVEIAVP